MSDSFAEKKFNNLLVPPHGWQAEELLTLNYSFGYDALNELVSLSGIFRTYQNHHDVPDHIWVFLNEGRCTTQSPNSKDLYARLLMLRHRIFSVKTNVSFHPKLTAILYRDKEYPKDPKKKLLRMIVSSRNLTTERNLEGGLVLETETFDDAKVDPALNELLKQAFTGKAGKVPNPSPADITQCNVAWHILHADFTNWYTSHKFDSLEFLTPQLGKQNQTAQSWQPNNTLTTRLAAAQNSAEFVAVSPFLNDLTYLEHYLPSHNNWMIITSHIVNKKFSVPFLQAYPNKLKCYAQEVVKDGNLETEYPSLHAKMYAYTLDSANGLEDHLLIGSANFSANGLEKNYELDVHIVSRQHDFCALLKDAFKLGDVVSDKPSTPPPGYNVAEELDDSEDGLLDAIAGTSENALLRQYFESVLGGDSHAPEALDYAMETLSAANDPSLSSAERITNFYDIWRINYRATTMDLPDELLCYKNELGSLIEELLNAAQTQAAQKSGGAK